MWIRGETFSLGGVDKIDRLGPVYDEDLIENELQAAAARRRKWTPWRRGEGYQPSRPEREYTRNYQAGQKGKRALAQLGASDWEQANT